MSAPTSAPPAIYDGELSRLYSQLFEQHAHPRGPWKMMLAAVHAAVPPGQPAAILDLATGPGEPAFTIARELPDVTVWATDVSGDMLTMAQSRMAGMPNARFAKLDMQDLSMFEDGTFDAVSASAPTRGVGAAGGWGRMWGQARCGKAG
jgi:ubiquinone/menaquinone biosynthesis C-methylase UbiE